MKISDTNHVPVLKGQTSRFCSENNGISLLRKTRIRILINLTFKDQEWMLRMERSEIKFFYLSQLFTKHTKRHLYWIMTLHAYNNTNSMELNPSWEAASCAAIQEFPKILWSPKIHCLVHKSLSLVPILRDQSSSYHPILSLQDLF
jgi:hypothetical protein